MAAQRGRFALVGALVLAAALWWGGARVGSPTPEPRSAQRTPALNSSAAESEESERSHHPPIRTLHQQATSAYHARLFVDDDGVVLVTQAGFTTLRRGGPAEEHAMALGATVARRGSSLVFWRGGALWEVALNGTEPRALASVPRAPQYLFAVEDHLVWILTEPQTGTTVQMLAAGEGRTVGEAEGTVQAASGFGDAIFWVLQSRDGSWQLGRLDLAGGGYRSAPGRRGARPPAMLAAGPDGVTLYAGPKLGVRRWTLELDREEVVSKGVVCSPLAVSNRVVCAQVGGLFELRTPNGAPRFLATERSGLITALAATNERAFWVAENKSGLVLRSVPLPGL